MNFCMRTAFRRCGSAAGLSYRRKMCIRDRLRSRLYRQYLFEHRPLSTRPHRSYSLKWTANAAAYLSAESRISGHLTRASCECVDGLPRHETPHTSEAETVEFAWLPQSLPVWSAEAPASLRRCRSQAAHINAVCVFVHKLHAVARGDIIHITTGTFWIQKACFLNQL